MKQSLGVVPREYLLSYVVLPMSMLVKYQQTIGMEGTHPGRVFRAHNVDLPHHPRSDDSRSDSGPSPKTPKARAAHPAAAEPRATAAGSHITERTKAKPGSSADAAGHTAASIP